MLHYNPSNDFNSTARYSLSYQDLRDDYLRFKEMDDDEFLSKLVDAIHFACIVCYLKEISTQYVLNDTGVIHELVHLLKSQSLALEAKKHGHYESADFRVTTTSLPDIRKQFNSILELA